MTPPRWHSQAPSRAVCCVRQHQAGHGVGRLAENTRLLGRRRKSVCYSTGSSWKSTLHQSPQGPTGKASCYLHTLGAASQRATQAWQLALLRGSATKPVQPLPQRETLTCLSPSGAFHFIPSKVLRLIMSFKSHS